MPDRGQRQIDTIDAPALTAAGEWTCPRAHWLQLTFEANQGAVLDALPCEVTRTVPCYARLFVAELPESPAGPLRMAMLLAGGRYEMQPRNVIVEAIIDGPADTCREAFGAGFNRGAVQIERDGPRVTASVAAGGETLATLELPALRALDPNMLRWDPWLGIAGHDGAPAIANYAIAPAIEHAFLTKGATLETPAGLGRQNTWRRFRSLGTVSACYAEGTLVFGERMLRATAG